VKIELPPTIQMKTSLSFLASSAQQLPLFSMIQPWHVQVT
jgi:hypothetical protein